MEEGTGKTQDLAVLINDLKSRFSAVSTKSEDLQSSKNSYMDLKINLLLNYFSTFAFKLYQEAKGENSASTIKSLIKHRCFIERLKPLDSKLQYQLDKIVQGSVDDELKMKPNPANMDNQLRVNEKAGIYKAPKLQAAIFEEKPGKGQRDERRLKTKLARSALIKNLKEEFDDNPLEIKSGKNKRLRDIEQMQRDFEEEHFTRVQLSKQELRMRRKLDREEEEENEEDVGALMKLIKPDKKKLTDSINYSMKKKKYFEDY